MLELESYGMHFDLYIRECFGGGDVQTPCLCSSFVVVPTSQYSNTVTESATEVIVGAKRGTSGKVGFLHVPIFVYFKIIILIFLSLIDCRL